MEIQLSHFDVILAQPFAVKPDAASDMADTQPFFEKIPDCT
jgi:hypothetical protein